MPETYYCIRQRAGPLTKEYRGTLPPRYSPNDTAQDRKKKTELKQQRRNALNRSSLDRLELRIAQLGKHATHYILEFDDEHLPKKFADVKKAQDAFLWRVKNYKGHGIDWIKAIEGRHGDHRYHIHFVTDYYQLSPCEVQKLWKYGTVTDWPVMKRSGKILGYRHLAVYLIKERPDGVIIPIGRHPWSCSRSLAKKLPPPEIWLDDCGTIMVPENAILLGEPDWGSTQWGSYYVKEWLEL